MPAPKFEPEKWNKNKTIKLTHNCYAYALDIIDKSILKDAKKIKNKSDLKQLKPQVGRFSGKFDCHCKYTRDKIRRRLLADCKYVQFLKINQPCPSGFYKVMVFFRDDNEDYHFYRQDSNKMWSHKDGHLNATNKDEQGRLIYDPRKADKKNYNIYGGCFAVPIDQKKKFMSY